MALQDPPTLREKRPVIVIGAAGDPHAASVVSILKSRGTHTLWLDSRKDIALRFSLSEHPEVSFAGQRPRALFVRHLPPRVPGFVTTAPLGRQERHETLMQGLALREAWVAALSLLEKEGIPLINGAHAFGVDQHKIQQLLKAQGEGLKVPTSVVQQGVVSSDESVVYKPLLNGEVRQHPEGESHHLVQGFVEGAPVRITMLDDEVLSAVRLGNVFGVDHRSSASYRRGHTEYSKITPPQGVIAKLRRLALDLNLRFQASDFMLGDDDDPGAESSWNFLEMNPMPAWLEIEEKTHTAISEALVNALLRP